MGSLLIRSNNLEDLYDEEFLEKYQVVSFDVFDTLLLRDTGSHYKLWRSKSTLFAAVRILAEIEARVSQRMRKIYEVDARRIYRWIDWCWKFDSEISLEDTHLFLNPEIAARIEFLLERGKKVILISDTHFTPEIIASWLKKRGLSDLGIYTSQEVLKPKSRGLFEYVREKLGLDYSDWLHVGDNSISDVMSPNSLGISSVYYPKLQEQILESGILSPEGLKKLLRNRNIERQTFVEFMLGFLKLQMECKRTPVRLEELVAILISSSVSQSIAREIKKIGRKENISEFWFVSRDGWLPYLAFKENNPDSNVHYFRTSRRMLNDNRYANYIKDQVGSSRSIIVYDLGWRGSTLKTLHAITPTISWFGVFLGLLSALEIPHRSLFRGSRMNFVQIWRARDLLEVIFSEPCESYISLDEDLRPVQGNPIRDDHENLRIQIARIAEQRVIQNYMDLNLEQASKLLEVFVSVPGTKLVALFSDTSHDVNGEETPLIHNSWKTLFGPSNVMWPQATYLLAPRLGFVERFLFSSFCQLKEIVFRAKSLVGRRRPA